MLPKIMVNWEMNIAIPAFETNLTLIYDKENRNLETVIKSLKEKEGCSITGVWQDCEFCIKFTFTFRKKFYL